MCYCYLWLLLHLCVNSAFYCIWFWLTPIKLSGMINHMETRAHWIRGTQLERQPNDKEHKHFVIIIRLVSAPTKKWESQQLSLQNGREDQLQSTNTTKLLFDSTALITRKALLCVACLYSTFVGYLFAWLVLIKTLVELFFSLINVLSLCWSVGDILIFLRKENV